MRVTSLLGLVASSAWSNLMKFHFGWLHELSPFHNAPGLLDGRPSRVCVDDLLDGSFFARLSDGCCAFPRFLPACQVRVVRFYESSSPPLLVPFSPLLLCSSSASCSLLLIAVGSAGLQQPASLPALHCSGRRSLIRAGDLHRQIRICVGSAGPQPPTRIARKGARRLPNKMQDRMPEDTPENMPERMSARGQEDMPERMPAWAPEDMPEDMPYRMSEKVPRDMPERMPEDMPERAPEDMPLERRQICRIECQKICQIRCRAECQRICEIKCQKICHNDGRWYPARRETQGTARRNARKSARRYAKNMAENMANRVPEGAP